MSALRYTRTTDNPNPHKTLPFTITHNSTENGKLFDDFPHGNWLRPKIISVLLWK